MKWFKHDSNAGMNPKLMKLKIKYGMEGYGLYWYCLELIAGEISEHKLTFELEHDADVIGFQTGIHPNDVEEMMRFMVSLGLFEDEFGQITCQSLAKRLDQSMTSSPKIRLMLAKQSEIKESHDLVSTEETRLEENRIEKKRKGQTRFAPPTLEDVKKTISENGYQNVNAEKFWNFYDSKGWMVGKNKMKRWKSALANWESTGKEEKKAKEPPRPQAHGVDYTGVSKGRQPKTDPKKASEFISQLRNG